MLPGSCSHSRAIAATMAGALKAFPGDRIEVVGRMTRLTGREMTLSMLNVYTAESNIDHNISLERAIAFDLATQSQALLKFFASKTGCSVLVGEDALLAEWGMVQQAKAEIAEREKALKQRMKGGR